MVTSKHLLLKHCPLSVQKHVKPLRNTEVAIYEGLLSYLEIFRNSTS